MGNFRSAAIAAAACLFLVGSLSAHTGTGSAQFQGHYGVTACFAPGSTGALHAQCGLFTNPYFEAFHITSATRPLYYLPASGTPFGPTEDIFCVDYRDQSMTGSYPVYFTNLGTDPGLVGTYTRANSLQQYLESAWLAGKIGSGTGQYLPTSLQAVDITGAIWQIMTGIPTSVSYGAGGLQSAGITSWVTQAGLASNWQNGVNASQWVVVTAQGTQGTAVGAGGGQEYLTHIVTPEPATLLLLGTGLAAMMLAAATMRRPPMA